jgi:hypothetical protein
MQRTLDKLPLTRHKARSLEPERRPDAFGEAKIDRKSVGVNREGDPWENREPGQKQVQLYAKEDSRGEDLQE